MSSNATPTNCLHSPPHADKRVRIIMHIANNCSATGRPNYGVYDHLVSMYSCSRGGIKNMWLKHKKMALDKSTPFKIVRKKGSGRKRKHTVESIKEMVKGVPLTNRKSICSLAKAINIPHSTLRRLMKVGDLQRFFEAEAKAEEKIKAAAEAEGKAVAEAESNKKAADELCRIDVVLEKYNMCCVCLDPYEVDPDLPSERRLPIKGACGHDFCETCLDAYFAQSLSGRKILRYIKCPLCNEKKAFDIQNKVTDHLLCDLLKARAPKTGSSEEDGQVNESSGMDGPRQLSLEVAMLRKKNEEAEKEMTRLMKRNEELEKVASENAQLRRRIQELDACSVGNSGL